MSVVEAVTYVDTLADALPDQVTRQGSVGDLCTYRVGGAAQVIVNARSVEDLAVVADIVPADRPILIVGAGSNLLVSDDGFDGVAITLGDAFSQVEVVTNATDGHPARVVAGGGAMLPRVARQLTAAGLTGFEWAVGVPGSVGGAVRMNAGGHGSDMAASVVAVTVFNLRTGESETWDSDRCAFSYRSSAIGPDDLVVDAELELIADPAADGAAELSEIVSWRRANQPGGQNAGSVFANPPGDSAGRLIDACGLKGFRVGTASVSDKHANFIQAEPNGAANDVAALIRVIQDRVHERFGVSLRVENRLIGFEKVDDSA